MHVVFGYLLKIFVYAAKSKSENQIKSNDGFVVRSIQRNRGLLRITTIKYKHKQACKLLLCNKAKLLESA